MKRYSLAPLVGLLSLLLILAYWIAVESFAQSPENSIGGLGESAAVSAPRVASEPEADAGEMSRETIMSGNVHQDQKFLDAVDLQPVCGLALESGLRTSQSLLVRGMTNGSGAFDPLDALVWNFAHPMYGAGQVHMPMDRRSEPVQLQPTFARTLHVVLADIPSARIQLRLLRSRILEDTRVRRDGPPLLVVEASGACVVRDLIPGWWSLSSTDPSIAVRPSVVSLDRSLESVRVTVGPLVGQTLRGTMSSVDGEPCAGVQVQLGSRTVRSDESGRFRLARSASDDAYAFLRIGGDDTAWREISSFGPVLFGDDVRITLARRTVDRLQVRSRGQVIVVQSPRMRIEKIPKRIGDSNREELLLVTTDGWITLPPNMSPEATLQGEVEGKPMTICVGDLTMEREDNQSRDFVCYLAESRPSRIIAKSSVGGVLSSARVEVIVCSGGPAVAEIAEVGSMESDLDRRGIGPPTARMITLGLTDMFGEVDLQFAPGHRTFVRASIEGHLTRAVEVVNYQSPIVIALTPTRSLRGRVVNSTGELLRAVGGEVHLWADGEDGIPVTRALVDRGEFELQTAAASGWLVYRPSIRQADSLRQIHVLVGREDGEIEVPYDDSQFVPVRIRVLGDPCPHEGDDVYFTRDMDVGGRRHAWRIGSVTVTRLDGALAVEAVLPRGDYRLEWLDPHCAARVRAWPGIAVAASAVESTCRFSRTETHILLRRIDRQAADLGRVVVQVPPSQEIYVADIAGMIQLPDTPAPGTVLAIMKAVDGGWQRIGESMPLLGEAYEVVEFTLFPR